jgi:hypothetical protein
MPEYRCPACKTRLHSAENPAEVPGDCVDDFVARQEASLARERLDLEHWVDQLVEDRVGPILAR